MYIYIIYIYIYIWSDVPLELLYYYYYYYYFAVVRFLTTSWWLIYTSWVTLLKVYDVERPGTLMILGRTSLTIWSGAPVGVFLEVPNLIKEWWPLTKSMIWIHGQTHSFIHTCTNWNIHIYMYTYTYACKNTKKHM